MRVPRLYTGQPLEPGGEVLLDQAASHYVSRVLRLSPGDPLVLFNGDGADYASQVIGSDARQSVIAVDSRLPAVAESPLRITLVQAISRGERMDQTLQKATELGAVAFRPLLTRRVEVRLEGERLAKRMAHWEAVIRSACEQCGRARLPELYPVATLAEWLARPAAGQRVALHPGADRALSESVRGQAGLELVVGPEGGLTDHEIRELALGGVERVRLGPRILRTETAGPAALAALQALVGDF